MQSIIKKYIEKGLSVVPEKDQKPLIKGWADFRDTLPTEENLKEWESLNPTGLGLVCGPQSNIIALDLDTDRQDILDEIRHLLPDSPIEKRGSKGWTRFFRYNPAISNTQVKDGEGKVVIEILAAGKKTTIPPSIHPNGSTYVWTKGKGLLDINVNTLPLLPPFLMETIELTIRNKFGTTNGPTKGNGRHVTLSSYLGTLIEKPHSVDSILMDLINKDKELHEVPYFSDPNEGYRSTSAINNALAFYTTHLETINSKAYKTNKTYVEPLLHKPEKEVAPVGKPESRLNLKCHEFIPANSVVKRIFDVMMANSWVPQPELALGAILSLGAVLTSRKFIFQGITTNLYISSIADSGCVDKDTEFFNGYIWKKISEYVLGDKVMQFNPNTGEAELVEPLEYIKKPEKTFIFINNERGTLNQMLSPEHRVLTYDKKGSYKVQSADLFSRLRSLGINNNTNSLFKTTFKLKGKNNVELSDDILRLQIAYCADGRDVSYGYNNINIKKERKKERLELLLKNTNTDFKRFDYPNGYSKFVFNPPILTNKLPPTWATGLNEAQCKVFIDEVTFWDGSTKNKGRLQYFSRHKSDVDVVQFIAARLGMRTSISSDVREGRTTVYGCMISRENTDLVSLGNTTKLKRVPSKDGFKYCFEVPSSFLVLRRNDRIFVTGNTGKNLGLEFVKSTLIDLGASSLLGAGDMASDAGITDSLGSSRPVQLYIMDEIGGILNTINNGDMAYNSKMADILAELYTSSTSKYLGRALAEGVKGQSVMPHLSILGATTPTGFRQGVTKSSLDKGLMGRFLLFFGEDSVKSVRVKKKAPLPQDIQVNLQWLLNYKPQEESITIGDIPYKLTELDIDEDADKRMDEIFEELDQIRIENQKENVGPVAARLYQQMVKLVIIHAGLNAEQAIPKICLTDVEFGYNVIKTNFAIFKQEIQNLIFSSSFEKAKGEVLTLYKKTDTVKFKDIVRNTPSFAPKFREMVLKDLVDGGILIQEVVGDQRELHYRYIYG